MFVRPTIRWAFCSVLAAFTRGLCWTILELDAVRLAAFQKTESYGLEKLSGSRTRHALNLELPQSQGASIATPEKASVHRKTALPCPLASPTPFRRHADRSEA